MRICCRTAAFDGRRTSRPSRRRARGWTSVSERSRRAIRAPPNRSPPGRRSSTTASDWTPTNCDGTESRSVTSRWTTRSRAPLTRYDRTRSRYISTSRTRPRISSCWTAAWTRASRSCPTSTSTRRTRSWTRSVIWWSTAICRSGIWWAATSRSSWTPTSWCAPSRSVRSAAFSRSRWPSPRTRCCWWTSTVTWPPPRWSATWRAAGMRPRWTWAFCRCSRAASRSTTTRRRRPCRTRWFRTSDSETWAWSAGTTTTTIAPHSRRSRTSNASWTISWSCVSRRSSTCPASVWSVRRTTRATRTTVRHWSPTGCCRRPRRRRSNIRSHCTCSTRPHAIRSLRKTSCWRCVC